jgi:hypothetical protein
MSMWQKLAGMLGVRDDQVEDALQNERGAKRHLSRRGFLMGTVALATSEILPVPKVYSLPSVVTRSGLVLSPWLAAAVMCSPMYVLLSTALGRAK